MCVDDRVAKPIDGSIVAIGSTKQTSIVVMAKLATQIGCTGIPLLAVRDETFGWSLSLQAKRGKPSLALAFALQSIRWPLSLLLSFL